MWIVFGSCVKYWNGQYAGYDDWRQLDSEQRVCLKACECKIYVSCIPDLKMHCFSRCWKSDQQRHAAIKSIYNGAWPKVERAPSGTTFLEQNYFHRGKHDLLLGFPDSKWGFPFHTRVSVALNRSNKTSNEWKRQLFTQ